MLMSTEDYTAMGNGLTLYPELAGRRVLITGIDRRSGADVARAFAEHRTRLILQFDEASPEMDALTEVLAPLATELTVRTGILETADDVVLYARSAAQAYGGLDVVVNLVSITPPADLGVVSATDREVEDGACAALTRPCLIARVAANRMRLTHNEGLVLTIAILPAGASAAERAFATLLKAAISAMTRAEAGEWADQAIRFNAIAPAVGGVSAEPGLIGEPGIAALAVFLASNRGKNLSGHIFEAGNGDPV